MVTNIPVSKVIVPIEYALDGLMFFDFCCKAEFPSYNYKYLTDYSLIFYFSFPDEDYQRWVELYMKQMSQNLEAA